LEGGWTKAADGTGGGGMLLLVTVVAVVEDAIGAAGADFGLKNERIEAWPGLAEDGRDMVVFDVGIVVGVVCCCEKKVV
jgi:hypothetical protein